jgi:hypothetical protein
MNSRSNALPRCLTGSWKEGSVYFLRYKQLVERATLLSPKRSTKAGKIVLKAGFVVSPTYHQSTHGKGTSPISIWC